jgi:hypothetical protein
LPVSAAAVEKLAWLQRYKARTAVGGRFPRVRVMDYMRFPNSKVAIHHYDRLYKDADGAVCPAVVHANYHPDKAETLKTALQMFNNCVVAIDRSTCAPAPNSVLDIPVRSSFGNGGPGSDASKILHAELLGAFEDMRSVLSGSSWELAPTANSRSLTVLQRAQEQLTAALAAEAAAGRLEQVPAAVRDGNWT